MACSRESVPAFILRPARSRRLLVWLTVSHATAVAGVLTLPIGAAGRVAALVALALHAFWRRPRELGRLVAAADGSWSLPDLDAVGLRVSAASQLSATWVELRLEGPGRRCAALLGRDQLSASEWRQLRARIRLDLGAGRLS